MQGLVSFRPYAGGGGCWHGGPKSRMERGRIGATWEPSVGAARRQHMVMSFSRLKTPIRTSAGAASFLHARLHRTSRKRERAAWLALGLGGRGETRPTGGVGGGVGAATRWRCWWCCRIGGRFVADGGRGSACLVCCWLVHGCTQPSANGSRALLKKWRTCCHRYRHEAQSSGADCCQQQQHNRPRVASSRMFLHQWRRAQPLSFQVSSDLIRKHNKWHHAIF